MDRSTDAALAEDFLHHLHLFLGNEAHGHADVRVWPPRVAFRRQIVMISESPAGSINALSIRRVCRTCAAITM